MIPFLHGDDRFSAVELHLVLHFVLIFVFAPLASAQENETPRSVESAREALRDSARFPWYDAQSDELKRVDVRTRPAPPEAKDWLATPEAPRNATKRRLPRFSFGEFLARLVQIVAWIFLAVLFGFGIYYAFKAMLESEISLSADVAEEDAAVTEAARIEKLPFDIRRPQTDLLAEARRLYEAGNYAEAIIYLFSYQLVQLDKNHWIRLTKGKTNRQYLREIRSRTDLRSLLHGTMVAFEDVFFGHHAIDQEQFESCWNRLDEFHQLAQPEGAA